MKYLFTVVCFCILGVIILLIASACLTCEHENMATMYSFASQHSTAYSDVRPYCRDCGERFQHQLFKGDLIDKSYLSAIVEHGDGSEIVPGEYYTVTATVPNGFYAYTSNRTWVNCKVENADYIVYFNVEFREEFREAVELIEDGEVITFRGRFYDSGCGFTDCELLGK